MKTLFEPPFENFTTVLGDRLIKMILLLFFGFIMACGSRSDSEPAISDQVFQVLKMKTPVWVRNTNIYEVNIQHFTKEGTFKAFQEHLPRLKELGVGTLCLLPIYPIGLDHRRGTLGNPYVVADFTKVNPELGSFEELRELVSKAHRMHINVIIDWISTQTAWDHPWVINHPDWYVQDEDGIIPAPLPEGTPNPHRDAAALNFESTSMRNTLIESMKFWLRSIDVDGFRCYAANQAPDDFWKQVRPALESVKPVFMVADAEGPVGHFETCFQANDGYKLYSLLQNIAVGTANVTDIDNYRKEDRKNHPRGYNRINYISNFELNVDQGSSVQRFGDSERAMAVIAFTFEGIPLLFNGHENGLNQRFVVGQQDYIRWQENHPLQKFYRSLLHLKTHNKALWNGDHGGDLVRLNQDPKVYAFMRTKDDNLVATIVNCSDQKTTTSIDQNVRSLTDLFTGRDYSLRKGSKIELGPWEYLVLSNPSIIL